MEYQTILKRCEEERHLISMIPLDQLVRIGYEAGMNSGTAVLDLACGYGTMLKLWHEAFGIRGVGVDRYAPHIDGGRARLRDAGIGDEAVTLTQADVFAWDSGERFDLVSCTETFGSFGATLDLMERFLKPGGRLIVCNRYSKTEPPPPALTAFEGETLSLRAIHRLFRSRGWWITAMATGGDNDWERYIFKDQRAQLAALRRDPADEAARAWNETWHNAYFDFRRTHEGFAAFVIEKA